MEYVEYILWGLAIFFAGSWTFGMLIRPSYRMKNTVVAVVYWWVAIAFVYLGELSALNLLWLMPLALILPTMVTSKLLFTN
jgi:hypothetical protein